MPLAPEPEPSGCIILGVAYLGAETEATHWAMSLGHAMVQRFQRDQGVELLTSKVGPGTRATVGPKLWQGQEPYLASSLSSLSSLARSPAARADPHLTGEIQVQIKTKS